MDLINSAIGGRPINPSLLNVFSNKNVKYIDMNYSSNGPNMFRKDWVEGYIRFEKGDTEGRQNFHAANFIDMLQQMSDFCRTL